jgi:uncharacterized protein YxjI
VLEADQYLIRERVKFFLAHQTYDIFDYRTQELIGTAEEKIGVVKQILRWFVGKKWMSTVVEVCDPDGALVFTIRRRGYLFRARLEVQDANEQLVGYFRSKFVTFRDGFWVYDPDDQPFAEVKGNLIGFEYRVLAPGGAVLGMVTKEWGGVAKELLTSANTYQVRMADDLTDQPIPKMLVLAAALAVDMIFKSENSWAGNG